MKYFRIFKAKKQIGQLNESERRQFSNNIASNISENIVSVETSSLAQVLRDVTPSNFNETKEDFLRICDTRDMLKNIEQETLDKAFEVLSQDYLKYLNSIKVINKGNLMEVSLDYLTLNWIDTVIHTRSLNLYTRLLEIKSALTNLDLWSEDLEKTYKNTSFGKSGSKPSFFINCSVTIKQKDRSKLFDSTWNRDFSPAFSTEEYKLSTELGSKKIWNAIANGMVPDLKLIFREYSGWLK